MSNEFPYTKDFPFTVIWINAAGEPAFEQIRAATPAEADEMSHRGQDDQIVAVVHGHPDFSTTPLDTQKHALPKRPVSDMAHAVFSAAQEGDDRVGLMSGFLGREPATFVVLVQEDEDGSVFISPKFVEMTDALGKEARSPDGDRLAPAHHEE